ncbi:MAG TPA: T9SS type A sorting domain-containing protein [Flavobacteriales bacterium]|nr:T9SS type A sorting domain-containing protein [Flavobacteriales bacterium]
MRNRYAAAGIILTSVLAGALALVAPRMVAQNISAQPSWSGQFEAADQQGASGRGVSPNALCDGATITPVVVGSPATVTGNNTGSVFDPIVGANVVWEAFTTTGCTNMTVGYCGTTPAFTGALINLYVGCPIYNVVYNSPNNVLPTACGDGNFTVLFPDLPAGTYYYPVLETATSSGPYSITFTATACSSTFPANALCAGAVEIVPGATCSPVAGTVEFATRAGNTGSGCGNSDAADGVWYSFVATNTTHNITVAPSTWFNVQFNVYEGDCSGPVELECVVGPDFGITTARAVDGLVIGNTYLIRVSDWYSGSPLTPTFTICITSCDADAGTLTADEGTVCYEDAPVTISATENAAPVVPSGFEVKYVLTSGAGLVIQGTADVASFEVDATGLYTIHTLVYDPTTLDLGTIVPGETTGGDVNEILIQGGGAICGSLDMVGAPVTVQVCADCDAEAGTLAAVEPNVCFVAPEVTVSATTNGDATVPAGFSTIYFLTTGQDQVIEGGSFSGPSFTVSSIGQYSILTLVYDPTTLDLGSLVFGESTAGEVNALLIQGGGTICGSLDMDGAQVTVEVCGDCDADAGSLTADASLVCYGGDPVMVSATTNGTPVVPVGFEVAYVLTSGTDLVIVATGAEASFEVDATGLYTIHTLVHDPATLDLGTIVLGETTGGDVNALLIQGGGTICGSLDVTGAPVTVEVCTGCDAAAGTLVAMSSTVCFIAPEVMISASANGDAVVPEGFITVYLLTSGQDLVIVGEAATPSFPVTGTGAYTIHTLVYDPTTLDLGEVELGVTTANEVEEILIQGGGTICASLDMAGAPVSVREGMECNARVGPPPDKETSLCLSGGLVTMAATANGDAEVPTGFETVYVLTSGSDLVIQQTGPAPEFDVTQLGDYTIHTLVYDPTTLDLGEVELGVTTANEVEEILIQGGGTICASLDMAGAPVSVIDCRPDNDDCGNAIEVPINAEGNCPAGAIIGDNSYATEEVENVPGCDFTDVYYADVWYTFNSGSNTEVTVDLDPMEMEDWGITVSDGCSAGTEIFCEFGMMEPVVLTTTENTTYWVRVVSNLEFGEGGEFALCLSGSSPTFVCDGGEVSTMDGETTVDVCQNGDADVIDFITTSTSAENYSFLVTDESNVIVTLMSGNSLDFNAIALGTYRVWGISYNGDLEGADPGSPATEITSTGDCLELSGNFVLVNVEVCSGIGTNGTDTWSIYPNPANGAFNVRFVEGDGIAMIEIIDMDGRLVLQESASVTNGQVITVGTAGRVSTGVYTVRLSSGNGVKNIRLVVQ